MRLQREAERAIVVDDVLAGRHDRQPGRRLVVRQPRQPHLRGRVTIDQVVTEAVPVRRSHVGEMPANGRDRVPLE